MTEEKIAKPSWVKMKSAELEKIVIELANEGKSPAEIGLILRDKHGVPKVKLFGKRLTQILEEQKINYKSEKKILGTKIEKIKNHISKNRHDYCASRALAKKLWVAHDFEMSAKEQI